MKIQPSCEFSKILSECNIVPENCNFVFHYTSLKAILSIIENGELWLSERNHMNDIYDEKYINRFVKKKQNPTNFKHFPGSLLDEDFIDEKPQYILSTSLEEDVAHQWTNYGKENAVCIEFNRQQLEDYLTEFASMVRYKQIGNSKEIHEDAFLSFRVFYDEEIIEKLSVTIQKYQDSWLECLERSFDSENNKKRIEASGDFHIFYCCTKQPGFYAEHEYRFVVLSDRDKCLRPGNNILIPYIKLKLENRRLPIQSITIGPNNHDDNTKNDIRTLLDKYGYNDVNVKESKLCMRN
jgi:hypothetical protein